MDTLEKLKTKILEWRDFYGGDILVESDVTNAKSKKDLKKVLENHRTFLEMQSLDAQGHVEDFMRKLKLNEY